MSRILLAALFLTVLLIPRAQATSLSSDGVTFVLVSSDGSIISDNDGDSDDTATSATSQLEQAWQQFWNSRPANFGADLLPLAVVVFVQSASATTGGGGSAILANLGGATGQGGSVAEAGAVSAVPEPMSLVLMGTGLLALTGLRKLRRARA